MEVRDSRIWIDSFLFLSEMWLFPNQGVELVFYIHRNEIMTSEKQSKNIERVLYNYPRIITWNRQTTLIRQFHEITTLERRETDDSHSGSEITTSEKNIRRKLYCCPLTFSEVDISQLDEITASEQNLRM